MGSGKTLSMVRQAYMLYKMGKTVYSNFDLQFPHKNFTLKELMDYSKDGTTFYDAVFLIDEAHIFIDSRSSFSAKNKVLSYFITQTRKKDVYLMYTTQHFMQVDKRLRQNTDVFVECHSKKARDGDQYTMNIYHIIRMDGTEDRVFLYRSKDFYSLYDTREVVKPI